MDMYLDICLYKGLMMYACVVIKHQLQVADDAVNQFKG